MALRARRSVQLGVDVWIGLVRDVDQRTDETEQRQTGEDDPPTTASRLARNLRIARRVGDSGALVDVSWSLMSEPL